MDFLNHKEGDVVFYQVYLLSPLQCPVMYHRNCKRLREFEEATPSQPLREYRYRAHCVQIGAGALLDIYLHMVWLYRSPPGRRGVFLSFTW